jgi:hypothetical protein
LFCSLSSSHVVVSADPINIQKMPQTPRARRHWLSSGGSPVSDEESDQLLHDLPIPALYSMLEISFSFVGHEEEEVTKTVNLSQLVTKMQPYHEELKNSRQGKSCFPDDDSLIEFVSPPLR